MLVDDTLPRLASFDKLTVRNHEGFWHCMDTYKDYKDLNKIWDSGNIPWKIWDLKPANTSHQHLSN